MLKIPYTCLVDKIIPKNKIYKHEIKNDIIEKITWMYKISIDTIENIKKSEVEEIQILQIDLKEKKLPTNILKIIAKKIPYPILFVLKNKENYCYAVSRNFVQYSKWNEDIEISIKGNDLKEIYKNITESIIYENKYELSFNELLKNNNIDEDINSEEKEYEKESELFINLIETPNSIFKNTTKDNIKLKESLLDIALSSFLTQIEDRIIRFITEITDELQRKNYSIEKINQLYINDYKYTAFTYRCLNCVLNEVDEEKINIYKKIFIKALTSKKTELININRILITISEMDYSEILYLQYYYYIKRNDLNNLIKLRKKICNYLTISPNDIERNQYQNFAINNLKNEGLINETTELLDLYSDPKITYEVSSYGIKVLEKI